MKRKYYSMRTGIIPDESKYNLSVLRRLFKDLYNRLTEKGYFQEYFGYECVDLGDVLGKLGSDIDAQIIRKVRKEDLWPISKKLANYSEDDLFDIIEFLYDHVSKPVKGYYHDYNGCGWHYETFNSDEGKVDFKTEINELLIEYSERYELSQDGEILLLGEKGLENLITAQMPSSDKENIVDKVDSARKKFLRYKSSLDERRDAIRDLVDILEYLRPQVKGVISKNDENDLFNIANNFGIRHHNDQQKINYEKSIWYSWLFYYYLATIHACIRLIQRKENQ